MASMGRINPIHWGLECAPFVWYNSRVSGGHSGYYSRRQWRSAERGLVNNYKVDVRLRPDIWNIKLISVSDKVTEIIKDQHIKLSWLKWNNL
jgi:hypothetical protein